MLSENDIMTIVKNYAKSPQGKKRIKETYGVVYDETLTDAKIKSYANSMKEILYNHIYPIIKSIELSDIVIEEPVVGKNGLCEIHISFAEGSLHRDSLYPEKYGDGLQNIILLFKNGYNTSGRAYGNWSFRGKEIARGIVGRQSREPNDFLDKAIIEFNNSAKNTAVAVLEGEYKN